MAQQPPAIQFEDMPLDQARRMGQGPRMEPMLYDTLRNKIQALSAEATRIHLGPESRPERMKHYILRIARELNVPVTVRKVPGGVIFWRSSDEDRHQAKRDCRATARGPARTETRSDRPPPKRSRPRDEVLLTTGEGKALY
jgi:hypothetical protein